MNSVLRRLLTVFISLFLLAYVGYQAYLSLYLPVSTQRAVIQTVEDNISANGFVINDEKLVSAKYTGILDYKVADGAKVSKNGAVANIYPDSKEAENERKIIELDNKIKQMQVNDISVGSAAIDINVLNSEINNKFSELAKKTKSSDISGINTLKADFLNLLNQKAIATGAASDFKKNLNQLTAEKAQLESQRSSGISTVLAPVSGYFVSKTDGFEDIFNVHNIMSVTTSQVNSLLSAKPAVREDAVGKVISSYEWYIVCVMNQNDAVRLPLNSSVNLTIPFSTENDMPATVAAKNKDAQGNYAVVLKCDYMTSDLSVFRSGNISIIINQYTGIKVDNSDVYMKNGVKGVYILEGNTAKFRALNVIYCGNGYMISKTDPSDETKLQLYDEVIVEGKNLYDGKIVK